MTGIAPPPIKDSPPSGDLLPRVVVGIILIAVALGALWAGGPWFGALATAATLLMFAEWSVMHRNGRHTRILALMVLAVACAATQFGYGEYAVVALAAVAVIAFVLKRLGAGAAGLATGLLYAGLPGVALIWLRAQLDGATITLWLMLVVWSTDILAYFAGRGIGGPKIAPRISPKKTWAGLAGGVTGAAIAGYVSSSIWFAPSTTPSAIHTMSVAPFWTLYNPYAVALGSAALAVVAQTGDFYESWLKRKAGVKDSGTLLPGHGGVMDRLDGLVPVAVLVAGVAWARGGLW